MEIIKALPKDYQRIRAFYHSLIDALPGQEYRPGWKKDIYPAPEDLRREIENGCLYYTKVGETIAAAMVVNHKSNPEYKEAKWKTKADAEETLVIHMLGVHSDFARKGIAKELVRFVIRLARESGMKAVRLDVLKGNIPAERLYPKLGFEYIETIPMFYEDTGWMEFELYELPTGINSTEPTEPNGAEATEPNSAEPVLKAKFFEELSTRELHEILKVRAEIFVVEQNCVYQDPDDQDYQSLHVFYEKEGKVIAYLRAYAESPERVRMGRVLTLKHGTGLGKKLLKAGIELIREKLHPREIRIHAQCYAAAFYEQAGFRVCSGEFQEDGIPHVQMKLE